MMESNARFASFLSGPAVGMLVCTLLASAPRPTARLRAEDAPASTAAPTATQQERASENQTASRTGPARPRARNRSRRPRWDGRHRIRAGDTLSRIARRYGVSVRDLRQHNRVSGDTIREGRQLRIPGRGMGRVRRSGARPAVLTDEQEAALARGTELGLSNRTGNLLLVHPPEPRWIEAAGERDELDGSLAVPVDDGIFLRGWGSGPRGYHLALDIGQRSGTTVRAAEQGIVLYAGNSVRGYGNMVIVLHPNGWTTWYGHNRQNLVVPGQRVSRAEAIATVGQTGYARGPHVHFMLVDGIEHCDARPLLDGALQTRSGDPEVGAGIRWTDERPETIQCATRAERPHPRRRRRQRRRARRRQRAAAES